MKNLFILIIFMSFTQCTTKKPTNELKNSNIKTIIENENLNVVYRGIRNPLTIYVPNADSIKVSGLGIGQTDENKYYIAPGLGTKAEITVIGYINGEELIDKRQFRILDIEKPYASINNNYGKITLSKDELANSIIKAHIPQFIIELPEILSFEYTINEQQTLINNGNEFNNIAKEQIYNLRNGDSMVIDNVKLVTDKPNIDRAKIIELRIYVE